MTHCYWIDNSIIMAKNSNRKKRDCIVCSNRRLACENKQRWSVNNVQNLCAWWEIPHHLIVNAAEETLSASNENEKVQKYQDLARELRKLWQIKVKVVPVVVGALGTIPKELVKHLNEKGTSVRVALPQNAALLGTARILRKTLEI